MKNTETHSARKARFVSSFKRSLHDDLNLMTNKDTEHLGE